MRRIIVILSILFFIFLTGCTSTAQLSTDDTLSETGTYDEFIRIPLSEISSSMKKYSFDADGVKVNYFVVKGTDEEVRTAFDACDVCGGYKGYRQQGTDVICNNCGRHFRIDDIGAKNKPGGCWPSFLSNRIEGGDYVLIETSEIAQGAFRFR